MSKTVLTTSSRHVLKHGDSPFFQDEVFVIYDVKNDTLRQLNINGTQPVFSPVGEQILFRRDSMTSDYYLLHLKGGNEELILSNDKIQSLLRGSGSYRDLKLLSWSPDGRFILFGESSDKNRGKIFALDVETKEIVAVH